MGIAPISSATASLPIFQATSATNAGTNVTQPKPVATPTVQGADSDGDNDGSGAGSRINIKA